MKRKKVCKLCLAVRDIIDFYDICFIDNSDFRSLCDLNNDDFDLAKNSKGIR